MTMIRLPPSLAVAVLALLAVPANAGSFTVNPVRLEIAAGQTATSMMVSNAGNAGTTVQVSIQRWTQVDGVDVLEPVTGDDAPMVTPPMFRLDVAGQQIVRIGFAGRQIDSAEGRWRVIVEELPQPYDVASLAPVQVAMRLRVNLPLFRQPAERRSQLAWSAEPSADGLRLAVDNRGTVTERIDVATLSGRNGQPLSTLAGPLYVFPGERRAFPLRLAQPGPTAATLSVQGSVPLHDHELALPRP